MPHFITPSVPFAERQIIHMKKICILPLVIVGIVLFALLLDNPLNHPNDVNDSTISTTDSSEYDAFRDPNVLWGRESEFDWDIWHPPGSVIVSPGLTDLMSSANETNMVAFTVELIHMCEFHPIDINNLMIPDSLIDDGYLLECIQLFNKADNLDRCTELYNEARMYVEGTVSTEEYLSYYYSWKTSDAKWVRSRFIEFGFIPVYDEEFTEQGQESIDKLLTFVGAPQDIQFLEEKITINEIYLLRLPKITYHNPLIAIKE